MNWQEKINEDLNKFFKQLFGKDDIKNRLRSERTMILNLLFNLYKIKTIIEDDISDINNMELDTKLSFSSKEQLYDYLFHIKQIIMRSKDFIGYCDRTIGDVNSLGDKDEKE